MEESPFKRTISHYFSDEARKIALSKGEVLLHQNQKSERLFYIKEGRFLGYLKETPMENYPVFKATAGSFIGVYSYLSEEHLSYTTLIADENSIVFYYDVPLKNHDDAELLKLYPFLIAIATKELFNRQHFAKKMAYEKHNDIERLLKAEKMATLGQLAAGLAHELNNSVGVIGSGLDHVSTYLKKMLQKTSDESFAIFNEAITNGQHLSSAMARKQRTSLKKHLPGISESVLKRLARTEIPPTRLQEMIKAGWKADEISELWELGVTLHDLITASKHAGNVVKSVKQLGVSEHQWRENVDVNRTISEALVILKNLTKRVEMDLDLAENLPAITACPGQLVQVWINIIKNGIESMLYGKTTHPLLRIKSFIENQSICVQITDNGPGIPQSIKNRIFEPSFTTKVSGLSFGLGLGLSIVQRILTEHNARIEVTSDSSHTQFIIQLPIT